jgi:peroxin-13
MEASTAAGFHMIESVVGAFGGFSQMLESTFFATHSSFMAMVGVVEQFGNLRNYLGQVLSIFAIIRWIRHLWYKITGKSPPVNPNDLTPGNFQQYQESTRYSRRPILFFVLAVFGVPYLMHKFIQVISRRHQEEQQQLTPPEGAGNNNEIITAPITQTNSLPQNLEFCRALYDFRGESSIELSFSKGDIIAILSKTDLWGNPSPWWRGRLRNSEPGMFPSNYIEIINKGGNPEGGKDDKGFLPSNNNNNNNNVNNKELSVEEFENKLKSTTATS